MLPLAQIPTQYINTVVPVYSLDGMTVLLGAFFFYCLANPSRVHNRTQFWGVFVCLLTITLFYALRLMLYNSPAGQVFTGVIIALCQAAGLVLTVLYVGGLNVAELTGQLKDAADDFRAGGDAHKPTIVPLTGAKPVPKEDMIPPRVVINLPKTPGDERIPLD